MDGRKEQWRPPLETTCIACDGHETLHVCPSTWEGSAQEP